IAFDRGAPVTQVVNRLNRGEATSPLAGSAGVLPQFVALHPQWDMGLDILNRIITRIGVEGVHGVHTVTTIAPAVTPFDDFEMDRDSPLFCGMFPYVSVSSRTDRSTSHTATSTVPTNGILIGRSATCAAVPVRSTTRSLPLTVKVTTIGRFRRLGLGSSKYPSM